MATILHMPLPFVLAILLAFAFFGWLALLLAVATLIHGRSWVWARAREEWRRITGSRLRRRTVLDRPLPPSRDRPIAFTPRVDGR